MQFTKERVNTVVVRVVEAPLWREKIAKNGTIVLISLLFINCHDVINMKLQKQAQQPMVCGGTDMNLRP